MEGYIRKKGKRWYYSFEAAPIDGKRKRIERVGGDTKKEAEAALREALREYNNTGNHFEVSELSLADYMDYWIDNYVMLNCRYNTQESYKSIIQNHIKPALGMYKIKALNPAALQNFINKKYIAGYSKNHLINIITVLGGALKYAVHPLCYIKESPMIYVKYPKYTQTKHSIDRRVITREEMQRITERFPFGTTYYLPIVIAYYTGFRIGELTALTWDNIDLENQTITINKTLVKESKIWCFGPPKTETSFRTIKIGHTLNSILKRQKKSQAENRLKYGQHYISQYMAKQNDDFGEIYSLAGASKHSYKEIKMVCTKENGELVTPDTVKYAARVINYEMGIVFNFHSLRHTHATILIENGANIKDVQTRLGHKHISTTLDTYTHATKKMSTQSIDIFEKAAAFPTK